MAELPNSISLPSDPLADVQCPVGMTYEQCVGETYEQWTMQPWTIEPGVTDAQIDAMWLQAKAL